MVFYQNKLKENKIILKISKIWIAPKNLRRKYVLFNVENAGAVVRKENRTTKTEVSYGIVDK